MIVRWNGYKQFLGNVLWNVAWELKRARRAYKSGL